MLTAVRSRRTARLEALASDPPQRTVQVVSPSPMIIPEPRALRREPPRKPEEMQEDYHERFDAKTLFYDTYRCGEDIWLSGPPLRNLKRPVRRRGQWYVDGRELDSESVSISDWGRTQRSRIVRPGAGSELALDMKGFWLRSKIGDDGAHLFAGRNTVVTKSADNDLVWIQDWLRWYHDVHGVTGVVFYENNSTKYRAEDIAAAITEVEGIEVAVVVDWQFKWGPSAGPYQRWDSDYSQYSMLEHARFRFLRQAAGVVSCDIDELVLTDDGRTVFDHAREAPDGVIKYHGIYIGKVTPFEMDAERQRRFVDYRYREGARNSTPKWTTIPSMSDPETTQWWVHSVRGIEPKITDAVTHRHYRGVSTGWKYNLREVTARDGEHVRDEEMDPVLDLVFGPTPASTDA